MPRNRMIKPEFWSDDKLKKVSLESRLLFIGLWNFADDYGFIFHSSRQIIGNIFPLDDQIDERKIKLWIGELIKEKLLIPLNHKDKPLLFVKGWGKHQTVANKSLRSYVDSIDIEDVIKDALESNEELISVYLESHVPKRKKKEERESNKEKDKYLECVFLSKLEYENLINPWGKDDKQYTEDQRERAIECLDVYIRANGKKYDSHYAVLQGWVYDKITGYTPEQNDINPDEDLTKLNKMREDSAKHLAQFKTKGGNDGR